MKRCLLFVVALLLTVGAGYAHTSGVVAETCPLCHEAFRCELDMSGTQYSMRLDLKPLGPTAAPWRLPVCPQCHFVLFADDFTAKELAQCREIVQSDVYRKHTGRASHYLLGLLYEGLKEEPLRLAHVFLKASWQEESDTKKLEEDLTRSLRHFETFLQEPQKPEPASEKEEDKVNSYQTAQLLKGEILRRLGRFHHAKRYLLGLQTLAPFQETFLAEMVRFEIRLCDQKDSEPHEVPDVKRTEKSEPQDSGDEK